jgi:DNA-binding NarL/FixJ family response regulator
MALERKKVKFEEFLAYREMIETQKCLLCNRKMFRKGFCHFHLAENKRQKDPFYTKSLKINPEIVYSLLSSGCTQKHIATILNVSRASICKFLKLRPYLKCK